MSKTIHYGVMGLLLVGFLFVAPVALKAQVPDPLQALPGAGLTPDSPFFFLDRFWEGAQMFFTFNPRAKAELHISFAGERVSEIRVMVAREKPNREAIRYGFERKADHIGQAASLAEMLHARGDDVVVRVDFLHEQSDSLTRALVLVVKDHTDILEQLIAEEERLVEQRFQDPAFLDAMERELRRIAAQIKQEIGKLPEGFGFVLVEDEFNENVDDDTYTGTWRAEADSVVDLVALQDRTLRDANRYGWESYDIDLTEDSLDITFEKTHPEVTIDGVVFVPDASVTISATVNSPEAGRTEINYDIDITLETSAEHLADLLEKQLEEAEKRADEEKDKLEGLMEAERSAEEALAEAEETKQELIAEATEAGVDLPARAFAEFDRLISEAQSAFQAGNFAEAKNLAEQAETIADEAVRKTLDEKLEALEPQEMREEPAPRPGRPERPGVPVVPPADEENGQERGEISCRTNADCLGLICPTVVGQDTPQCGPEGVCICGPGRDVTEQEERY